MSILLLPHALITEILANLSSLELVIVAQAVIGTPVQLRDGVKTVCTISNAIDYVYYDAFRLRSVTHSCLHRADVQPNYNCAAKKTCMRMRKRYYIRNIAPLDNDKLARLLTTAPNRT